MKGGLWSRLVLPLVLLSMGSLAAHALWSAQGFFLNLATELVGIIITVAYVDWILKRHEAERWHGADKRIQDRLVVFLNQSVTSIRVGLGVGPDVLDMMPNPTLEQMHQEVLRVAEHVLEPSARNRLDHLDQGGWKNLMTNVHNIWDEAGRLIERFGYRLEPHQMEVMLDIQQAAANALGFWRTFPDFAGVPDDKLPTSRPTPPVVLKRHGYDTTAAELRKILRCTRMLASRRDGHTL